MISGDRTLASGKQGAFYHTLEEFRHHWQRIDIITPGVSRQGTRDKQQEGQEVFDNVYVHPSPWSLIFQPLFIFKKGIELWRLHRFGLVTVHEFPPFYNGIGARLLWQKIRVPYVLETHHIPGYPRAADIKERLYRWLTKMLIRFDAARAVAVRAVNQHETPGFLVKAGVPREKIRYIPSMYIDTQVFKKYIPPAGGVKEYDLIFVSRIEKNKGIFNLIDAINIARKTKPDIRLLLVGNGSQLENLKLTIKNLKLEANVIFSGWLASTEDVARAYNSARIFLNPSFNEGGPRVAIEAMACGVPVITTQVGLMHDIIKDGETGIFCDWSPEDMATKVLDLLASQALQDRIGAAGLEIAQRFDRRVQIKNYAESLKKLV